MYTRQPFRHCCRESRLARARAACSFSFLYGLFSVVLTWTRLAAAIIQVNNQHPTHQEMLAAAVEAYHRLAEPAAPEPPAAAAAAEAEAEAAAAPDPPAAAAVAQPAPAADQPALLAHAVEVPAIFQAEQVEPQERLPADGWVEDTTVTETAEDRAERERQLAEKQAELADLQRHIMVCRRPTEMRGPQVDLNGACRSSQHQPLAAARAHT
eukprot:SAG22_NODE_147_length_17533_cov_46.384536_3_plen_211_part_00